MRTLALRTFLALAGLTLSWTAAEAVTLKEPFELTHPLAAGGTLTLENTNGSVTLEAWDRNEVRVEAEKRVKASSDEQAREIMKRLQIEVKKDANSLSLVTKMPRKDSGLLSWLSGSSYDAGVTYRIRVPRSVTLDAGTVNGGIKLTGTRGKAELETVNGTIQIEGAQGSFDLETTNGAIQVARTAGGVRASTTNGSIDVRLTEVAAGEDLSFATTNGSVTLQLPRNARASVDAAATNGRVSSDFEVDGESGKHRLEGDINGGGGRLRIRTTNGSVKLVAE
ncbi:MAG TPA: DUF4097 family beta strand repeat-containing protein [Thermoanaerobaculia bacterium]